MEELQELSEEELMRVQNDLVNEREDFMQKIFQCKESLQEEVQELQKRYYRLERMRENCDFRDKKLLILLDENQNHLYSMKLRIMEIFKELDTVTNKKIQEWNAKQEDISYWLQKAQEEKEDHRRIASDE